MTNSSQSFAFPLDDQFLSALQYKLSSLQLSYEPRLCVVSIIGQGRLSRCHSKGTTLSSVIGREALRGLPSQQQRRGLSDGKTGNITIQGHVDLEQRVVYLHLVSVRDAAVLSRVCASFLARSRDGVDNDGGGGGGGGGGNNDNDDDSFHSFMAEAEFEAARALLFLFSVSHLVVVNNPGSRFDLSLVRLFRNLETIRQKLAPSLTEALRTVAGVSKEWMYAGRPCSPRMLFVFEKNPLGDGGGGGGGGGGGVSIEAAAPAAPPSIYGNTNNNNNMNRTTGGGGAVVNKADAEDLENIQRRGVSTDAIKRLQHNMEDQIYRILRKARVITNISNNSLFAVPANEEFVYVMRDKNEGDLVDGLVPGGGGGGMRNSGVETLDDPMTFLSKKLSDLCGGGGGDSSASSKASKSSASLSSAGSSNQTWSSTSNAASSSSASSIGGAANLSVGSQSKSSSSNRPTTFKAFVRRHIDQALNKGFDDNLGRNPVPALFELPRCGVWFEAAAVMYEYIIGDVGGGGGSSSFGVVVSSRASTCISNLKTLIDVDARFSEARCSKVVPLAIAAYQEGILNHYTESFHNKRVNDAIANFDSHARGPAYGTFLQQVKDECDAIWRDGRQSCEATTLTGNHCIHALHRLPTDESSEHSELPVQPHQTLNKTLAASNCGTRQASREDPFDIRAANFTFYDSLDEGIYDQFAFPLRQDTSQAVDAPVERKVSGTSQSKDVGATSSSSRGLADFPSLDGGVHSGQGASGGRIGARKRGISTGTTEEKTASTVGSEEEEEENLFVAAEDEDKEENKEIDGIEEILVGGTGGVFEDEMEGLIEEEEESGSTSKATLQIVVESISQRKTSRDESSSSLSASPRQQQPIALKGMLTTTSPPGSIVEFSSWCLMRIGNAGSYNAGKGLDQPGFLTGSNFLLPWDMQIGEKPAGSAVGAGPTKGKSTKGYLRQKKNLLSAAANLKECEQPVIRAYVGYEYECPRGHRFISSSPDSPDGGVNAKASPAEKLVGSDMPLYTLCPCRDRSTKVFVAQLMRIFIVTPDRLSSSSSSSTASSPPPSVKLLLCPRVQPAPSPAPVFHPGGSLEPFPLESNCLWVLRLPHIYTDEEKVYSQPKDVALFPSCRVMKGLLVLEKGGGGAVDVSAKHA